MLSIPFEMTELVEYSLYGHFVAGGSCVEAPGASLSRRRRQRHELRLGGGGAGARTSTGSTFNPKKKKNFHWRLAAVGQGGGFPKTSLSRSYLI